MCSAHWNRITASIADQRDPLKYLESKLSVAWVENSELIEVSLSEHTNDPRQLAIIVNRAMASCLSQYHQLDRKKDTIPLMVLESEKELSARARSTDSGMTS